MKWMGLSDIQFYFGLDVLIHICIQIKQIPISRPISEQIKQIRQIASDPLPLIPSIATILLRNEELEERKSWKISLCIAQPQ
uniref:Uncharacterized protein n=1 Tax=Arundo donax TaxID=35708 RepID=A0A0A9CU28_ARUDO